MRLQAPKPPSLQAFLAFAFVLCVLAPNVAFAQGARFAVLIQGASGEEQYATKHRGWLDALTQLFRTRFNYDAAHLTVLAEQPRTGESRATSEIVKSTFARLAETMTAADQLSVVLIGHGTAEGADGKFNLVGPDLGVADWAGMLKPVKGRIVFVDTTSGSFPFLAGLSAPGRVIVTATSANAQRYHTEFPQGFVKAFSDLAADLDKNGRVSVFEAFTFASRAVKQYFDQAGTMATETALIDDDGNGTGRLATATEGDGEVASSTYFDVPTVATSGDPETQRLLVRQQQLNEQVDDLRRRRGMMTTADYDAAIEKLLTELALVSRDIRQRSGS